MTNLQQRLGNQSVQRMIQSGIIQPKLKISNPNDTYEVEADMVAEQVIRMPQSNYNKETASNDSSNNIIYKKCSICEIRDKKRRGQEKLKISKKSVSNSSLETSDEISNQIKNSGNGKPLDPSTKQFMESRFDYNFSNVRIHDDYKSNVLANYVNARAFTVGTDIFLSSNESMSDKKLMAHELTHVVQQDTSNQNVFKLPTNNETELQKITSGEILQRQSETPSEEEIREEIEDELSESIFSSIGRDNMIEVLALLLHLNVRDRPLLLRTYHWMISRGLWEIFVSNSAQLTSEDRSHYANLLGYLQELEGQRPTTPRGELGRQIREGIIVLIESVERTDVSSSGRFEFELSGTAVFEDGSPVPDGTTGRVFHHSSTGCDPDPNATARVEALSFPINNGRFDSELHFPHTAVPHTGQRIMVYVQTANARGQQVYGAACEIVQLDVDLSRRRDRYR